jgi:Flp pilus assembly protein TadG
VFIRLRQLLRRGRGQEGVAAVEFAIILPILLLIISGLFDFGWAFYWKETVANASRGGARYAALANYPSGARTVYTSAQITSFVQTTYGNDLAVVVAGNSTAGSTRSVTVTKTMQYFVAGFLISRGVNLPTTISNTTSMTME